MEDITDRIDQKIIGYLLATEISRDFKVKDTLISYYPGSGKFVIHHKKYHIDCTDFLYLIWELVCLGITKSDEAKNILAGEVYDDVNKKDKILHLLDNFVLGDYLEIRKKGYA